MKKIGLAGAGIMAKGMAGNFVKHGYEVHVWNRTKEHVEDVLGDGAQWAESPRALVEAADIVIECVSDDTASRAVWTDPQTGMLAGARKDAVYIASSSLSLAWTDELAGICRQNGLKFLDMPLTGSRAGAEGGTLKLLVGGDKDVLESIRPELAAIADKVFYFGPAGSGMRFKLVLNTLIGIHTNAAAQAAELARAAGLNVAEVHRALMEGGMGPSSPATDMLFKNMDMPDGQVNFAVKWIEKDLGYAQAMARQYGVDFDLLNDTKADFTKAKQAGLADMDQTKIRRLFTKD